MKKQHHSSSNSQPFIDMVFSMLHLSDYTSEQQEQLLDSFSAILFEDLIMRFIVQMSSSERTEFYSLLDQDISEEDLISFIKKKVLDVDRATQEALQDFTKEVAELGALKIH